VSPPYSTLNGIEDPTQGRFRLVFFPGQETLPGVINLAMVERYSRVTACHEAGHAVVAWALGLVVGTICVRADDAGGGADIGSAEHLCLTKQIAARIAGAAAEDLFDCHSHDLASFNDNVKIMELLEEHGISEREGLALRAEAYRCARKYLEKNRAKVAKLVDRLAQCGEVDGVEFLQLMQAEANGG
jgi:hypothetical protein